MATARRAYFRVADSILHEPWPREVKLTAMLLMAYASERWARDGLCADEACTIQIPWDHLPPITGHRKKPVSLRILRLSCDYLSIIVRSSSDYVEIFWPKLAEFQGWRARELPESAPAPAPAPKEEEKRREEDAPEPASNSPQYLTPLLNLIARMEGDENEKRLWLAEEGPVIEADSEAGKGTLKQLAVRYYRHYLKGDRPHREEAKRERARARAREMREAQACNV